MVVLYMSCRMTEVLTGVTKLAQCIHVFPLWLFDDDSISSIYLVQGVDCDLGLLVPLIFHRAKLRTAHAARCQFVACLESWEGTRQMHRVHVLCLEFFCCATRFSYTI